MAITVKADQYIFPPRSSDAVPRDATGMYADAGYIGQLKYNDTHIMVKFTPSGIELWTRHGQKVRSYTPTEEVAAELEALREIFGLEEDKITIFDGGLLDSKHVAIKDQIVLWDIIVLNDVHLLGTTYDERFKMVTAHSSGDWMYKTFNLGRNISPSIHTPVCYDANEWDGVWELVAEINAPFIKAGSGPLIEGMMYKNPYGKLKMGFTEKNNSEWMGRSRVTTGRHPF